MQSSSSRSSAIPLTRSTGIGGGREFDISLLRRGGETGLFGFLLERADPRRMRFSSRRIQQRAILGRQRRLDGRVVRSKIGNRRCERSSCRRRNERGTRRARMGQGPAPQTDDQGTENPASPVFHRSLLFSAIPLPGGAGRRISRPVPADSATARSDASGLRSRSGRARLR